MSRLWVTNGPILPDTPLVVGFAGRGVLVEDIPTEGESGGALARELGLLEFPADDGAEVWLYVTRWPAAGTLFVWPDSTLVFTGPDGTHTAEVQLVVDGEPRGAPQEVTFVLGGSGAAGAINTLNTPTPPP